jgi:hypothetical protein
VICALGLGSASCSSPESLAVPFVQLTVPPGDAVPAVSGPVTSGQSQQFIWDFNTHLSAQEYATWVKEQTRPFETKEAGDARMLFATHIGGDSYQLVVTVDTAGGTTHVHVQLTGSPD